MPRTATTRTECRALVPVSGASVGADVDPRDAALTAIAARMGVATLDRRNRDELDFHEVAMWQLKAALEAAYAAGRAAAQQG